MTTVHSQCPLPTPPIDLLGALGQPLLAEGVPSATTGESQLNVRHEHRVYFLQTVQ